MEVISSADDEVFGQFDFNDNTPVLEPQVNKTMAMSPTSPQKQVNKQFGGQMKGGNNIIIPKDLKDISPTNRPTSPIQCPSNASSTSDSNATYLQGAASSLTDENTNNDFFYDDEFTGFDDNICDGAPEQAVDTHMLDSADINNILSMSRLVGDDNEPSVFNRIVTSKSDSCLYQGDLSMSSDGAMAISQDQSFSEGDVVSSSDLSELRSEPLFSPQPDEGRQTPSYAQLSPMDSLVKSGSLNNSFLTEEERYAFDWTANKDKYMISCVHDEDSSLQDSCPSGAAGGLRTSLSSWAQRSSGQITWSSHCSSTGSSKESGTESPLPSCAESPSSKPAKKPRTRPKSLTTWASIKKGDSDEKLNKTLPNGLTSWKSLKEESVNKEKVDTGVKSKSLPNLPKKSKFGSDESIRLENPEMKKSSSDKESSLHVSQLEELLTKKNVTSGCLLELFQRLKLQQEDIVSPGAVQNMMMGTWSMSDASSVKSGILLSPERVSAAPAPGPPPLSKAEPNGLGLTSWNTLKNLSHLSRSKSSTTDNDSLIISSSGNCSSSVSMSSSSNMMKHSFGCGTSMHSVGVGSSLIVSRDMKTKESRDFSSQFPPRFSDCCIQTSFEERERVFEKKNQNLQASVDDKLQFRCQKSQDIVSPPPKPPRQPHLQKTRSADSSPNLRPAVNKREKKKLNKGSISNKMSDSILNNLSRLPDLSFLNRNITEDLAFLNGGMTRSASSSDEFTRDPIFRPVSSMNRLSKPFSLFHPVHDDFLRRSKNSKNQERKRSNSIDPTVDTRRSTSSSRETSPVVTARRRTRKGRESSPSDFHSSSSSGIDPGSVDSQGTRTPQYFSDLALFSPSNSDCNSASSAESDTIIESLNKAKINAKESSSMEDLKGLKFNMPKVTDEMKPKDVRIMQLKEEAKLCKQMETAELGGSASGRGKKKSTEYIDIKDRENVPKLSSCDSCERCSSLSKFSSLSPTNSWTWSPTTSMESSHNNNSDPKTECIHFQVCQRQTTCRSVVMSGICEKCSPTKECMCQLDNTPCPTRREAWVHHAQCLQNDDKSPLKPCLVKRRKARKAPMKHRSWSDTRDLQIMRYSQEGQTRYQLIMPPCGKECVHGLSSKCVAFTSLPADVLLKTIGEQVVAAAGGKLHLQHVPNQCSVTNDCEEAEHKAGCCIAVPATTTVTNSPEPIPIMPCPCCQSSAGCTSSTCSSVTHDNMDGRRARKSVSFSEEISYHSPYPSPHPSPKKQVHPIVPSNAVSASEDEDLVSSRAKPIHTAARPTESSESVTSLSSEDSGPPNEFTVSPGASPPGSLQLSPTRTFSPCPPTHELVVEVVKGAEIIVSYFATAHEAEGKMQLGSTVHNSEIGHLVLRHICPPVYTMLMDGLNPQVRSLFGKMRNNVWKVIEDSAEHGPTVKVVSELVRQLKTIDFLSTSWLRFNAFVFGLLNNKSLDFWLDFLRTQDVVLSRHYSTDSFLHLSNSTGQQVYNEMTAALRPLAQLPFRLDYDFGLKELHEKQQKHMADQLQEKNATTSVTSEGSPAQMMSTTSSTSSLNSFASFTSSNTPSASSMSRQTKELLQQGSRLLAKLPTQTSLLSWGSSTLGSMFSNSKVKALAGSLSPTGVKTVPELRGINDNADVTSGTSDEVFKSAEEPREHIGVIDAYSKMIPSQISLSSPTKTKAIPVVRNNEILAQEYYEDSLEGSQLAAQTSEKINRIAKQMVGISSPERKVDSAYKKGVTEYTFEDDIESSVRDMKAKILAERQNSVSCDSLERSTVSGSPKRGSAEKVSKSTSSSILKQCDAGSYEVEVKPVPQISLDSDSGIDDFKLEACAAPADHHIPTRQEVVKLDPTSKRWSDTEATQWMSKDNSSKLETSITKAKKRWSTFGPTMIKLFDKMLLPEEKEIKSRPTPPPKPKRMATIDVPSTKTSENCSSGPALTRAHTTGDDTHH